MMASVKPTTQWFTILALFTALGLGNVQFGGADSASATNQHRMFHHSANAGPSSIVYPDGSMKRTLIYPNTRSSPGPVIQEQTENMIKNISTNRKPWALAKRDTAHVTSSVRRRSELVTGDSSSTVETNSIPVPSATAGFLNFNGAICRNESSFPTSTGTCQSPNATKPLESGDDQTASPYYTIVNLDHHNDVLCDQEYDAEEYNENCFIDHNVTCVGDPLYCNLTYDEYRQLLMDYIYPSTGEWILIASHSVVFIIGLVGNALVCIAVYTNHTMRTVTNIFIVNLAVADFFVILCCLPPTVVWDVTETWFLGQTMCKVIIYFQTVSVTVSVLTLTFISIDRWYAICFPLRYKPRPERAWRSIAVIWLIGFLSDLPEFLVLTTRRKKLRFDIKLFTQCVATWDKEKEKTFYIIKFVFLYLLPLIFMTVAYIQIILILWRSDTIPGHRESRTQPCGIHSTRSTLNCVGNTSTMGQLRARRKAAKMLVAVVIMFAGCYCPVHMLNVARYSFNIGQNDIVAVLSLLSHWLCYANSAANPVIYNFMSGKFRREFKNALEKCQCLRNPRGLGGRVGGHEDRSMYHTATRMNMSPSTRSNCHMTSNTQQTSFNGSRHLHNRNCINHAGSLTTQRTSPVSTEEHLALTKNVDGYEQSVGTSIANPIPTNNNGSGEPTKITTDNYTNNNNTIGNSNNLHNYHQQHENGSTNESTTSPSPIMTVNRSSTSQIDGT
ncbi:orexin receptor type 2-like isoform X2 [Malaya genurostris]|uniref:orexin receptor type 2-like isoform X2 n=1 Tax=Malaya genurostris TaxID=325434 RepID=UPI0026F3D07F|nr:orexin receptor type 2-like isoform X2 [Malaya genurostris]